jgi:hypothetical protein
MRQRRGRARLATQALALRRLADQMRRQRLERDRPAEARIGGEIDTPHSAPSELADDRVRADSRAGRERFVVGQEIGRLLDDRLREKGAGARMMIEKRQHLGAHCRIIRRFLRDPRGHARRIVVDRRLEQIADPASLLRRHPPLISRNSQARASAQRRFNVAGDMPSASAVSSMLRPAK